MSTTPPHIHDVATDLEMTIDGDMAIHRVQHIPDGFLENLKSERLAKAHLQSGEMNRVASVPVALIDIWLRQGRDFYNASAREIVGWLRKDNLEAFVTARGV